MHPFSTTVIGKLPTNFCAAFEIWSSTFKTIYIKSMKYCVKFEIRTGFSHLHTTRLCQFLKINLQLIVKHFDVIMHPFSTTVISKLPSNFCAAFELWSSSFNPHSSFLALHMKGLLQLYASLNIRSSKQNEYGSDLPLHNLTVICIYHKFASSRRVLFNFKLFWPKVTVHKHQISPS